ncbi:MAG: MATE family efflux transporter [Synergistaceae bacterium]|jgi:putative MATE family efflux protein|nr:MATE family efflux transporter [Synergistaceae bacterium]
MHEPERMGTQPILKLLVTFALPSIAGMVANALYNIVDRMFVGLIVGPEGLAAISLCFSFMLFNMAVCLLFGVGASPLMSIALGGNDRPRAERILGTTATSVFVAACSIALFSAWKLDFILRLSGAGETLLEPAREYLEIILWGIPFSALAFTLNFCIRAEGRPAFAMGTQMLGAFSNIVLDAVFIIYLDMGIAGAAWGTIISQGIAAVWVLSFYFRRLGVLRFRAKHLTPRLSLLGSTLPLGLSPFLTEMSFTFFFILFNRALAFYGGDLAVSAMGAFMGWDSLLFMPVIGIGEAAQTLFAYNYGARFMKRILEILKWALILASVYFICSALSVTFWAEKMLRLFTADAELLNMAAAGARISYAGVLFVGIALIGISFFQGLGKAKICLFLNLARQLLFLIPALWFLPKIWGLSGVWYCFPAMDIGGGTLALCFLLWAYKRLGLDLFEDRRENQGEDRREGSSA